jgi:hypothetical protein
VYPKFLKKQIQILRLRLVEKRPNFAQDDRANMTRTSVKPRKNWLHKTVLKGHDFSRVMKGARIAGLYGGFGILCPVKA